MKSSFDAFVSYDELTGKYDAETIKASLERKKINVFVAHIERVKYSNNFEETIDNVIRGSKYFILLVNVDTLGREQVVREFKKAYPYQYGQFVNPKLAIFHHKLAPRSSDSFTHKTGVDVSKINQQDFENSGELAAKVSLLFTEFLKPILDSSISLVQLVNELQHLKPELQDGSSESYVLVTILDKITESYLTLHNNLWEFATLSFENKEKIEEAKEFIKRCTGTRRPSIEEQLKQARVRCRDIENIYYTSLQDWFNNKKLTQTNRDYVKKLFTQALNNDFVFVKEMEGATQFLQTSAEEIYPFLDRGNFEEASKIIESFTLELRPKLKSLGSELDHLIKFKNQITGNT